MQIPRFRYSDTLGIKKYFDEQGYVIISNGLDQRCLDALSTEISNLVLAYLKKAGYDETEVRHISADFFTLGLEKLEQKDHEYIAALYDTIFQTPSFMRLISTEEIASTIRSLLHLHQEAPLYGFTNRCLIAPPSDNRRTYGWHQEVFYTIPRGNYIQTWAPLVYDTNVQNGTIEILPGSHKEGIAQQSWIENHGRATQILVDEKITSMYKPLAVDMKLGELLFFSGQLVHRSGQNTSKKVRYSLVGMYHDVDHVPFFTPKLEINYRRGFPKEYFQEVFGK